MQVKLIPAPTEITDASLKQYMIEEVLKLIDFTKYEGESFATLAEMYAIERNEAIKQYARFKAQGGVR